MTISPALKSFLDLLAWSEGTSSSPVTQNDGYDVIVSGVDGKHTFTDFTDHPFANGRPPIVVRPDPDRLVSTASGRYQIILGTWSIYKGRLDLTDFSPASQDAVAAQIVAERGAAEKIAAGDIAAAITLCSNIWASLPGNNYGQGGKPMDELLEKYQELSAA